MSGSAPSAFQAFGNRLFFVADDGVHGYEPWTSDGTEAGTVLLRDIYNLSDDADCQHFVTAGPIAFFTPGSSGPLWRSDGTTAGTFCLAGDDPDGAPETSLRDFAVIGGVLYYTASNTSLGTELYRSDGTCEGTWCVKDMIAGSGSSSPYGLTDVAGTLYFGTSAGLWRSDGTTAGTALLSPAVLSSSNQYRAVAGDRLFFAGRQPGGSYSLWVTDGTAGGTVLVSSLYPTLMAGLADRVLFQADDKVHGSEWWVAVAPAEVRGTAWHDLDGDALCETGEPLTGGRTFYLDLDGDGALDQTIVTFASAAGQPVPDRGTALNAITVQGVTGVVTDLDVTVSIHHPLPADLGITLISPSGRRVGLLSGAAGHAGPDLLGTTFDDQATADLNAAAAPHTGRFRPLETLAPLAAEEMNGVWTLEVRDRLAGDVGYLEGWALTITVGEPLAKSGDGGGYVLRAQESGDYQVREALLPGWASTMPSGSLYTVHVDEGRTAGPCDFGAVDVNRGMTAEVGRLSFDRRTYEFSSPVTIRHAGDAAFANVRLVLVGLPASVILRDAAGTTADGCPYLDLSDRLLDGRFCPGDCVAASLSLYNPDLVRLDFQVRVDGEVASVPGAGADAADDAGQPELTIDVAGAARQTLTVGSGGVQSAGGTSTVDAGVILGADSTWNVDAGSTLVLNGTLSGTDKTLTKTGGGTLVINGGQNPSTGLTLAINGGTVKLGGGVLVLDGLSFGSLFGSNPSPAGTSDASPVSATAAPAPQPDASPAAVPAQPSAAPVESLETAILAAQGRLPADAPKAERPWDDAAPPFLLALPIARAIPVAVGATVDCIELTAGALARSAADLPGAGEEPGLDDAPLLAQDPAADLLDVLELASLEMPLGV